MSRDGKGVEKNSVINAIIVHPRATIINGPFNLIHLAIRRHSEQPVEKKGANGYSPAAVRRAHQYTLARKRDRAVDGEAELAGAHLCLEASASPNMISICMSRPTPFRSLERLTAHVSVSVLRYHPPSTHTVSPSPLRGRLVHTAGAPTQAAAATLCTGREARVNAAAALTQTNPSHRLPRRHQKLQ